MCDSCRFSIPGYDDPMPPKPIVIMVPPRPDLPPKMPPHEHKWVFEQGHVEHEYHCIDSECEERLVSPCYC